MPPCLESRAAGPRGRPPHPELLTPAEQRVLDLVREGLANAEIAVRLGITIDGVKYHISNMLGKLHLDRREELARWQPQAPGVLRRAWFGMPFAFKAAAAGVPLVVLGGAAIILILANRDANRGSTYPDGLVSVGMDGAAANGDSYQVSLSKDGRFAAFLSAATNLVPGDTNGATDIFVRDRLLGTTVRVSASSTGEQADAMSDHPVISEDGRYVAFASFASNLVPGSSVSDADVLAAFSSNVRQSADAGVIEPTPGELRENVFVHDLRADKTELISIALDGRAGNLPSSWPSISSDGRYVAFQSVATNLVESDSNGGKGRLIPPGGMDVFVRDRQSAKTTRISVAADGQEADGSSSMPAISADGSHVAFISDAQNLRDADSDPERHLHVLDLRSGALRSLSTLGPKGQFGLLGMPVISGDGKIAAVRFAGARPSDSPGAKDPVQAQNVSKVRVFDLESGAINDFDDSPAPDPEKLSMSSDGRFVSHDGSPRFVANGGAPPTSVVTIDVKTKSILAVPWPPTGVPVPPVAFWPNLSPDASEIAYIIPMGGLLQVYVQRR